MVHYYIAATTVVLATCFVSFPDSVSARIGEDNNILSSNHRRLVYDLGPVLTIPFDAGAFEFSSFSDSHEKYGNCPSSVHPIVDGKVVSDATCISRGAECYISHTVGGVSPESVTYYVEAPYDDLVADLTFRVASYNVKEFQVAITQGGPPYTYTSRTFTAPGKGWEVFEDVVWKGVEFQRGTAFVTVVFTDGNTNLCSFSASETFHVVPFHAAAFDFSRVSVESTQESLGNCGLYSIVDGQTTDDEVCLNRGSDCAVAFTTPGEDLVYYVKVENDGTVVDPVIRLASPISKRVYLEIETVSGGVSLFTEATNDFGDFRDYRWSDYYPSGPVTLDAGTYRVDVQFVEGQVNFCSLSFPLAPTLVVPFDASALMDYYSVTGTIPESNIASSCDVGSPVASRRTQDSICMARSGDMDGCYVAYTDMGETLVYAIEVRRDLNGNDRLKLTLRLASNGPNKRVRVSVDGEMVGEVLAPGSGWEAFEDRSINRIKITKGFHLVQVEFLDGVTNLCSISADIND